MERVRTISLCIFLAIFWGGILSPCSLAFSQELDDQNRSGKLEGAIIISPPSPKYIQLFQEIGPQKQPYIDFEVSGLQQKVRSNPLNVKLHYELGFEYAERGFFEESSKELEKALALDPNFVKAMVVLGTVYFNTKKYNNGERLLLAALKLDENNALALNNLACLYYYSPLINKDRFQGTSINVAICKIVA